jgi:hypothetical protein
MHTTIDTEKGASEQPDIVWGAQEIGRVINISTRQAFFLLANKKLPAKKVGGRYAASRRKLIDHVTGG